jgi:hypothetical protein
VNIEAFVRAGPQQRDNSEGRYRGSTVFVAATCAAREFGSNAMKKFMLAATLGICIVALVAWLPMAQAYERYNNGCNDCHGAFTDATSTKGSIFPGGNKHDMHNDNSGMNADCNLCHTQGDNRDPFIGSSDGTAINPGIGCNGCHNAEGLRAHHAVNDVTICAPCHMGDPTPPAENVTPPYYGTADCDVDEPCNAVAASNINENWTVGDFIGTDNDGDGLYDGNDPDCGDTGTPGQVFQLLVTAHDRGAQTLSLSYGPACLSSDNNFYFGALTNVATPTYSGQECAIGNTGSYAWGYAAAPVSSFFLIAGHDTLVEGSYGNQTDGTERGPAGLCPQPQDLSLDCTPAP